MLEILDVSCSSETLSAILYAVKGILSIIQIAGPILLIISAAVRLIKMVSNPEEKNGIKKIINQFLAAAIIFFIPVIINVVMKMLGSNLSLSSCWNNIEKPNFSSSYTQIKNDQKKSIVSDSSGYDKGEKRPESTSKNTPVTTSGNASVEVESMIRRAEETLGSRHTYHGYVWTGDPATSEITCSGLVDYALGRPSQTDSPETLRDEIGMQNITTDVSKLKRGDLVFYQFYGEGHSDGWGHVGIYLGDNRIIHSIPNGGVQYSTVEGGGVFLGGGTLLK